MNKKKLIISIVVIVLIVITVAVSSYAYFSAINTKGEENIVTTGTMALEFRDGSTINTNNMLPGDYVEKEFSVENIGNIATTYDIYLSEVINTFVDQSDLVYELESLDGGYNTSSQIQVPNTSTKIINGQAIEVGEIHHYKLKITFLSKDENQDDNQGKRFSATIRVNDYKDVYLITYDVNGGNALTNSTTSILAGVSAVMPTPTHDSLIFDGWYTQAEGGTQVSDTSGLTESITLYAHWKSMMLSEYITSLISTDNTVVKDSTTDQNIRYVGATVNNYVYFNCDNNNENCEKWRIVGVFGENTKIVRSTPISSSKRNHWFWDQSTTKTELNGTYYNGLSNYTKSMINNHLWQTGRVNGYSATNNYPRETETSGTYNIGLISATDYLFAADPSCWDTRNDEYSNGCYQSDWLFNNTIYWTINPTHYSSGYVAIVGNNGNIDIKGNPYTEYNVIPSVYLNSDVIIEVSDTSNGTDEYPYKLSI